MLVATALLITDSNRNDDSSSFIVVIVIVSYDLHEQHEDNFHYDNEFVCSGMDYEDFGFWIFNIVTDLFMYCNNVFVT